MRNLLVAIAIFLLVILTPNLAIGKAPTAKSLLWEISGNQLAHPSYLFGTIHSGCTEKLALTPQQQQAINKSQQLYLEADINNFNYDNGYTVGEERLEDVLKANEYKKVKDFFEKRAYSDINLKRPSFLAFVAEALVRREFLNKQCKGTYSREQILIDAANRRKMKVLEIETGKDRTKIFKKMLLRDGIDMLLSTIDKYQQSEPADIEKKVKATNEQYFSGDVTEMAKLEPNMSAAERRIFTILLDDRNRLWIPRMRKIMARKSTFFGFGGAHLGGKVGVISLLEADGYKLKPIFGGNRPRS